MDQVPFHWGISRTSLEKKKRRRDIYNLGDKAEARGARDRGHMLRHSPDAGKTRSLGCAGYLPTAKGLGKLETIDYKRVKRSAAGSISKHSYG